MTPVTGSGQTTLDARMEVTPAARVFRYTDYWGTPVTAFDVHTPHRELTVTATSIVETGAQRPFAEEAIWADLEDPDRRDQLTDYLVPTPATEPDEELSRLALDWTGDLPPRAAALALSKKLAESMDYVRDVTHVHTHAVDAWRQRSGVCQDITHVLLALLRARGLPARYVSGYVHPVKDAVLGETVEGESHAWVEWWDGAWTGYDPTNGVVVGERHVIVARGREYADVPPLKGVFSGAPSETLGVSVEITRLG